MTFEAGKLSAIQLAITSSALEGDAAAIYHMISDLLGEGMPFDAILLEVLSPVQNGLGERWRSGDYLISEEHAATSAIETVVALLAGSLEQPEDAKRVVIACVEGDDHSLPGRFLNALLLYRGFRTTYLGGTMPADDLEKFLLEDPPDAVALTCAMTTHLPGALASIAAAHNVALPVIVGGDAFGEDGSRAARLGADDWAPDLLAAVDALETWEVGKLPTGDPVAPSSEYLALIAARPAITAAASSQVAGSPEQSARHHDEVELLFDVLLAAMVCDEDAIIDEYVGWFISGGDDRSSSDASAALLIEALQDAVGDEHPEAALRLSRAEASLAGS